VTIVVPSSQVAATANASGIEWVIFTNSMSNGPALNGSPGSIVSRSTASLRRCSSSFERTSSIVSPPP